MTNTVMRLWLRSKDAQGQTMAEYAVILGVICLAVIGVVSALSGGIQSAINGVTTQL